MKTQEVLRLLELSGTEQNQKIYKRHGVNGSQFGVSFTKIRKMAKEIGRDAHLAEMLWRSGNHDARILASMVMDPQNLSEELADRWVKDLDNYVITDAFSDMMSQANFAVSKAEEWIEESGEWVSAAGWNMVSHIALKEKTLEDPFFEDLITVIEENIHQSPNRTRYSMNNALIAIGVRNDALEAKAKAAAKRIGKVKVDHGETSCKTPDAFDYIEKTWVHQRKKVRA